LIRREEMEKEVSKAEFKKAVDNLSTIPNLLSPIDAAAIGRLAVVICEHADALEQGDRRLAREAAAEIAGFHSKFGMDPRSRSRLAPPESPQQTGDTFEEFLKTKTKNSGPATPT